MSTQHQTHSQEAIERITNDLVDLLWPELDAGLSKDQARAIFHNAIDAWEPDHPPVLLGPVDDSICQECGGRGASSSEHVCA